MKYQKIGESGEKRKRREKEEKKKRKRREKEEKEEKEEKSTNGRKKRQRGVGTNSQRNRKWWTRKKRCGVKKERGSEGLLVEKEVGALKGNGEEMG